MINRAMVIAGLCLCWSGTAMAKSPDQAGIEVIERGSKIRYQTPAGLVVQPNFRYQALFTPDDPGFGQQWNFSLIGMPEAWDADTIEPLLGGDPSIVVAVLDTGVAYEDYQTFKLLPDLGASHIWTNTAEKPDDALDNDGNGFIDDIHGWNFITDTNHANDDNGHGTHIAGTIASATNNGYAVAGIAFNTTIMPVKVLDAEGSGSTATIAAAIRYATANGADIINLSLGGSKEDPFLRQAIQEAVDQGVVVVAAAGNDGITSLNFPARYEEVVSVGAIQFDQTRAPYSNTGATLDLVAPGGNTSIDQNGDGFVDGILQETCQPGDCTTFGNSYYSGTSQAAAHVSAALALLEACGSTGTLAPSILVSTAKDLGGVGADAEYGAGLIDVAAALRQAGCQAIDPDPPNTLIAYAGQGLDHTLRAERAYPFHRPHFAWTGATGATYRVSWGRVSQTPEVTTQTASSFRPELEDEGTYIFKVQTTTSVGRISSAQSFIYQYRPSVVVLGVASSNPSIQLYSSGGKQIRQVTPTKVTAARVVAGRLTKSQTPKLITLDHRQGRQVSLLSTSGQASKRWSVLSSSFTGSLDAAILKNGDQSPVMVVATRTKGAEIVWYTDQGKKIRRQLLYQSYRGGLYVTNADVQGDGVDELIVSQASGGEVRIYRLDGQRLATYLPLGKKYRDGWSVAGFDDNADGKQELLLAPRTAKNRNMLILSDQGTIRHKVSLPKEVQFPVQISGADLNGDGRHEIVFNQEQSSTVYTRSLSKKTATRFLTVPKGAIASLSVL